MLSAAEALTATCAAILVANVGSLTPGSIECLTPPEPGESLDPAEAMNALMLEAVRRVRPPAIEVIVQPPGGQTLVNLDTIFLAEAEPLTRPVQLLGRRVLLRIIPSRFTWVHGDGSRQVTREPGRRYQPGIPMDDYVTHRYVDAGETVHPRVDVGYSAKYSLNGGTTWTDVVGEVTIAGPAGTLEVVEARPVLVGNG